VNSGVKATKSLGTKKDDLAKVNQAQNQGVKPDSNHKGKANEKAAMNKVMGAEKEMEFNSDTLS
jgi:uncharacterized membrane protein YdfJ with MMPL/SSD domain